MRKVGESQKTENILVENHRFVFSNAADEVAKNNFIKRKPRAKYDEVIFCTRFGTPEIPGQRFNLYPITKSHVATVVSTTAAAATTESDTQALKSLCPKKP